ncbi:MAG: hypothetical protein MAG581_02261 [Deltaproteobacteria bacterium]|jgi:hypothetical protein|nr:hypothetical protein [Deltaproteobacteria bacterium]
MSSPEIILSFNEILFYFTRAAVGVGVPYGLAEDYGRSSIWIGSHGLDPALITSSALQELESLKSGLDATITESNSETVLLAVSEKPLSALLAGPAVCDLICTISENHENIQQIIAKNVDCPFLVAAAIGSSNKFGWEISWQASKDFYCSVLICEEGSWKASWKGREIPEQNAAADVKIVYVNNQLFKSAKLKEESNWSGENRKRVLETGVPIYESWPVIHSFFSRCLVPSTEESRKSGAGAGLVDTD